MIADVRMKIRMRTRALYDQLSLIAADPQAWGDYLDRVSVRCGHRLDWRCVLASIVATEHPGCTIRVGEFRLYLNLPPRYKGSERTVEMMIPDYIRGPLKRASTDAGREGRRFTSCTIVPLVSLPSTKARTRGRN
jgi:hypothetical protein